MRWIHLAALAVCAVSCGSDDRSVTEGDSGSDGGGDCSAGRCRDAMSVDAPFDAGDLRDVESMGDGSPSDAPSVSEGGGDAPDGSSMGDAPVNATDGAMSDAVADATNGPSTGDAAGDAADGSPVDAGSNSGCGCGSAENCVDGGGCVASNDVCAQAIDATSGGTWTGSACNADDSEDLSCSAAGSSDVYFYLGAAGDYLVSVGGGFSLAAFAECPRVSTPSLCISPFPSTLTTISVTGETWIVLEPRQACGSYTIRVIAL